MLFPYYPFAILTLQIAIARALLKNTKIVLLDEATSMVDVNTERLIQSAFKELAKGRTLFVVA
jgi:ABC-type multidrug transport system fused ATPase/permease subunit